MRSVLFWIYRVIADVAGFLIILISVLAGIAQILAFIIEHENVVVKSLRNMVAYFVTTPVPDPKCVRYEMRFEPLDCDAIERTAERMLCKVTVPPVKKICVTATASRQ